jgi:hypothetical protein
VIWEPAEPVRRVWKGETSIRATRVSERKGFSAEDDLKVYIYFKCRFAI